MKTQWFLDGFFAESEKENEKRWMRMMVKGRRERVMCTFSILILNWYTRCTVRTTRIMWNRYICRNSIVVAAIVLLRTKQQQKQIKKYYIKTSRFSNLMLWIILIEYASLFRSKSPIKKFAAIPSQLLDVRFTGLVTNILIRFLFYRMQKYCQFILKMLYLHTLTECHSHLSFSNFGQSNSISLFFITLSANFHYSFILCFSTLTEFVL